MCACDRERDRERERGESLLFSYRARSDIWMPPIHLNIHRTIRLTIAILKKDEVKIGRERERERERERTKEEREKEDSILQRETEGVRETTASVPSA